MVKRVTDRLDPRVIVTSRHMMPHSQLSTHSVKALKYSQHIKKRYTNVDHF